MNKKLLAVLSMACLVTSVAIMIVELGFGLPQLAVALFAGWGGYFYGVGIGGDIEEEKKKHNLELNKNNK